uniref:Putative kinase anchor protein n=1 Tax=Nyssomyia neivai TaxID=330878 RepID=A0A1L8DLS9_9DIPT
MKAPVLPVLVGISLCGISATLILVYLRKRDKSKKKQNEGNARNSPKSLDGDPLAGSADVVVRNEVVPVILGREGSSHKAIEEKTRTKIEFCHNDDFSQKCTIRGKEEDVIDALKIIKQLASRPVTVTEEVLVPQSACGKIIGRCGEALQEICRKSQAKVSVESGDRGDGTKRHVMITGTQAQVNTAKLLIEEKVKEDAEARKAMDGLQVKREPRINHRTSSSNSSNSSQSKDILPPKAEKLRSTNPDGQMEVYVSAIANPSKFWVQMIGPQCADLDHLVSTMTEYYEQQDNQKLHCIRKPYLGQIVAALFKYDNKWYRAEVIAIQPNEYQSDKIVLDIYYVDYGDSAYVETTDVYQLRTDFLTLRFQAIECFLANVKPASIDNSSIWDKRSVHRFEELTHVAQWKKLLSRVVSYREKSPIDDSRLKRGSSPVPGVELFDPSSDGQNNNIALQLVAEGLASSIDRLEFPNCATDCATVTDISTSHSPSYSRSEINGSITPNSSKRSKKDDDTLRFLSAERLNRKRASNVVCKKT